MTVPNTILAQATEPESWNLAAAHAGLGQLAFEWRITWWKGARLAPALGVTIGAYDPEKLLDADAAALGFAPPGTDRVASTVSFGATYSFLECGGQRTACLSAIGLAGLNYFAGQPGGLTAEGERRSVARRVAPRLDLGLAVHLLRGPVRLNLEGRVAALHYSGVGLRVGPVVSAGLSFGR